MAKATIHGFEVDLAYDLLGVHYWIQIYQHRIPAFEIFEYLGKSNAMYFFQARIDNHIIYKTYDDLLNRNDFKPFLIDLRKLEATLVKYEES